MNWVWNIKGLLTKMLSETIEYSRINMHFQWLSGRCLSTWQGQYRGVNAVDSDPSAFKDQSPKKYCIPSLFFTIFFLFKIISNFYFLMGSQLKTEQQDFFRAAPSTPDTLQKTTQNCKRRFKYEHNALEFILLKAFCIRSIQLKTNVLRSWTLKLLWNFLPMAWKETVFFKREKQLGQVVMEWPKKNYVHSATQSWG